MAKRLLPLLLIVGLGACSDSVTVTDLGKVKKPAGHDQMAQEALHPKERRVVMPPSVRGKYESVEVLVNLPKGGKPVRLEVPLGGYAQAAGQGVEVAAKDYLPSFAMVGEVITSQENGPANPAVWLDVRVQGQEVFRGWVFRNEPDLMPPLVPGYAVKLLGVKAESHKDGAG